MTLARTLIVSLVLLFGAAGHAQSDFYAGKTIELLVGFNPGGGTDTFARFLAEHLGNYIPGNPNVIVNNMPGAGSVVASNFYVDSARRDGETLLVGTGQLMLRILLGLEGSRASLADFEAVLAGPTGRIGYIRSDTGYRTPADLANAGTLILGVPDHISTIESILALEILGANFIVIPGYGGKSEVRLAFERGEVNVDAQTTPVYWNTVAEALIGSGIGINLFSQGLIDGNGDLVRDPAAPEIPTIAEVYQEIHGTDPSGNAWEAYKAAIVAIGNGGKILLMHSDAPDAARSAVLNGVAAMAQDPVFLAAAEAFFDGYEMNVGEELAGALASVQALDPSILEWLKGYLSSNFGVSFD